MGLYYRPYIYAESCSVLMSDFAACHTNKRIIYSALEVFLNDMRYINPRFTYLLTYLLTRHSIRLIDLPHIG